MRVKDKEAWRDEIFSSVGNVSSDKSRAGAQVFDFYFFMVYIPLCLDTSYHIS